jgi:hypothetical protein
LPVVITLEPAGVVVGGRTEAVDDDWGGVEARIRMDPAQFGPDSSSIWSIWPTCVRGRVA